MDEEKKLKKYTLQLKMKSKNRIEFIPLITDTLDAIDKITSISYVKERLIAFLPELFLHYLIENFDKGDLIIISKQNNYLKELPTIQREDRYMAYITRSDISQIILDKIIQSRRINGRKLTQADYFMNLIAVNYSYSKVPPNELISIHDGQYGKRVAVSVLADMGLIPNKKDYYPTAEDVTEIQNKLFTIYLNSSGYIYSKSQMQFDNFVVDKGVIMQKTSNLLFYDILPYLKRLLADPEAIYYIDNSYLPQNMPPMPCAKLDVNQDFGEYLRCADEAEAIKQKYHKHALYQSKIKDVYFERINEHLNSQKEQATKRLVLERRGIKHDWQ